MKNSVKKLAIFALTMLVALSMLCMTAFAADAADGAAAPDEAVDEKVGDPVDAPVTTIGADSSAVESPAADMLAGLFSGTNLAILGVALAIALPCIGSAKGVGIVGEAATGLLSEQPDMFGKAFPLMALPMTQGIYGLVAAFMTLMNLGLFKNPDYLMNLTFVQGGYILMAALPIALAGLISAIRQGRVAATGINLIGKRPNSLGHAITTAALVETYAMFALLITIVLILRCPFRV